MKSGKLRHIITIQQPALAADGVGEPVPTWGTFAANIYAQITPLNGAERIQGNQINATVTHNVRTRYMPGVTPKMRILYGSRTLQITNVQNIDERDRELELACVEGE
jgi:SPP1 family predicted phage head-tail adaptor